MKIKPPVTPPSGKPADGGKAKVSKQSNQIANALAGLAQGSESKKKEKAQEKSSDKVKQEARKRLKKFGAKAGIQSSDTPKQATMKLVHSVLEEEYDSEEKGFSKMVDDIAEFIQENPELKDKFNLWISEIQSSE